MQIEEVIKEHKIDMSISQTYLRVVGANEDLSTFKNHTLFYKKRGSLAKKGGGLLTGLFSYLDSEREWILIQEVNAQIGRLCRY